MSPVEELPIGTVTFLFTDIEGSTRLLKQLRNRYGEVLADHQTILREAFAKHGGHEIDTQGDSFFIAFLRAKDAVAAAIAGQTALADHPWPDGAELRVRMGIHTGEPAVGGERYVGLGVHRAARICAAGHGGQVLVSQTSRELLRDDPMEDVTLRDLGEHQLKDLDEPERLYQLVAPGLSDTFPPLKTAAPTPFAGREGELAEAAAHVVGAPRRYRRYVFLALGAALAAAVVIPLLLGRGAGQTPAAEDRAAAETLSVIDTRTEKVASRIQVGSSPSYVAFGAGSYWVANSADQTLTRVEAKSRTKVGPVVSLGVTPGGIAFGEHAVWVSDADGPTLLRIDARFATVDRIPLRRDDYSSSTRGVAVGGGSVWVAHGLPGRVERVDPTSKRVIENLSVPGADRLAFGDGTLWVGTYEVAGGLARIDTRTNAVAPTAARFANPVTGLVVGGGYIWASVGLDGAVWRVTSSGFSTPVEVGAGPAGIAFGDGAVWVANSGDGTVTRIDTDDQHAATISIGARPSDVVVHDGQVAVSVLRNDVSPAPDNSVAQLLAAFDEPIDPATSFAWGVLYATCAKLLNYPDMPGTNGMRLEPEVAASMPTVSADGRTYRFRIRSGYRFSPPSGARVTARTFKNTIERALSPGLGPDAPGIRFLGDVVGARAFHAGRASHISGVAARGDVLEIKLLGPSGDLTARLAMPFFCAVPEGTPVAPNGLRAPIASAGPYYVARHIPDQELALKRNPSYAGRRPHFFEELRLTFGVNSVGAVAHVKQGRADYFHLSLRDLFSAPFKPGGAYERQFPPRPDAGDLERPQYTLTPSLIIRAFALNTHRPLFRDVRLRRAVNYALDRAALAHLFGARATDQYLPPSMPGFHDERIYPLSGPDLARAKALAGKRRRQAVLWTCGGPICRVVAEIARSNLAAIGITVKVKAFDGWLDAAAKRGAGYDLLDVVYGPDYADPANVLDVFFNSASIGKPFNRNFSYLDNGAIEARLRRASRLRGERRLRAYGALDVLLARTVAPMAAFAIDNIPEFFSARLGCQTAHPQYLGVSFAGLCLKRRGARPQG